MELISHPIVAAIILLGLLVFFHEAGHFIVGRLCGISVESFSIGFGPQIFSFKKGVTQYQIGILPLGGFVKFYGMLPTEPIPEGIDPKSVFYQAKLSSRIYTVAAGPLANLLLAFFIYVILGSTGMPYPPAKIGQVELGSAADKAGLVFGDKILSIDGKNVKSWMEMRNIISKSPEKSLNLNILRENEKLSIELIPQKIDRENLKGEMVAVGRAGVARGAIPSIVYATTTNSKFKTGDRIKTIFRGDLKVDIQYWLEVEKTFRPGIKMSFLVERDGKTELININETPESLSKLGISDAQLVFQKTTKEEYQPPLLAGDRIISWNGTQVKNIYDLYRAAEGYDKKFAQIKVIRDFKTVDLNIPLFPITVQLPGGAKEIHVFAVNFLGEIVDPEPELEKYALFPGAIVFAFKETITQTTFLVKAVAELFTGDVPLKALGGPMMIAKVAGDSAKAGWKIFLATMALISVNLGILNLIPIPVLDGGQLVILGYEGFVRKRPSLKAVEGYQKIGFAMIFALVVLATYNDLSRFWTEMIKSVIGQ